MFKTFNYTLIGLDRNIIKAKMELEALSHNLDSGESESEEDCNSRLNEFVLSDSDISEDELEDILNSTSTVSHVRYPKKSNVDRVNAKGESKLQQAAILGTDLSGLRQFVFIHGPVILLFD